MKSIIKDVQYVIATYDVNNVVPTNFMNYIPNITKYAIVNTTKSSIPHVLKVAINSTKNIIGNATNNIFIGFPNGFTNIFLNVTSMKTYKSKEINSLSSQ